MFNMMYSRSHYPACVKCQKSFGFNYRDFHQATNPLLLHCGHSLCEGCVTRKLKTEGGFQVKCEICPTISSREMLDKEADLKETFPLSTYTVGQIILKRHSNSKQHRDNTLGFFSHQNYKEKQMIFCGHCGTAKADCQCLKCESKLCSPCFTEIHKLSQIFKNHVKSPLKSGTDSLLCEDLMCKKHSVNLLEFYCTSCSVYCCKECCVESHLSCRCVSISEMNEPHLPEFEEMYEEASKVLKQLYCTQKHVWLEGEKVGREEVSDVQKQVMIHFSKLHGLLQLQEVSILKQIRKVENQTTESLCNVRIELENRIKEMENLLVQCKASMENENRKNVPLVNLLEKLRNVTEMPCYLVSNGASNSSKMEFTVDEELVKTFEKHFTLTAPQKVEFELISKSNLPEDYKIEPIPEDVREYNNFIKNMKMKLMTPITQKTLPKPDVTPLPQAEMKTKKSPNIPLHELLRKNTQSMKGPVGKLSPSPTIKDSGLSLNTTFLKEGIRDVVVVCHLNSPSDFYVQSKSCEPLSRQITDFFSKQSNIKKDPPKNVNTGYVYIHQYTDKKWYRCVVKHFLSEDKCAVVYIDYGNKEITYKKRLRDVPEDFLGIPALASHCKLYGCQPILGEWTPDATFQMARMVENEDLDCFVEQAHEHSDLLEVRLNTLNATESKDFDINQAMIFLEHAKWTESVDSETRLLENAKDKKKAAKKSVSAGITIKKDETFEAVVSHIVTPSHFYIQKRLYVQYLREFDQLYSRLDYNDSLVYRPFTGMLVAVKSDEDKTWKRGTVIDTPKPKYVTVQMIDFGNTETVFWKQVRKIDKIHMKTVAQAVKCKLSDIVPKFEKGWTKSAIVAFEKLALKNKVLKVYVDDVKDSCLKVMLYETCTNKDININGKLVQMGHARSVGLSSRTDEYSTAQNFNDDRTCSLPTNLFVSKSSQSITSIPHSEFLKGSGTDSIFEGSLISEDKSVLSDVETATCESVRSSEQLEEDPNNRKLKVQAVKIISPAEMYFTTERLQKRLETLKVEMTYFYIENTGEEEHTWQVGDKCAALRKTDDTWYRGLVREVSPASCKVFMIDIAELEEVKLKDMRILQEQFIKQAAAITYKCFLTGIIPPAGMSSWPGSTNDELKVLINNYPDLYIQPETVLEEDGVIPVKLYSRIEKTAGALEPTTVQDLDLSQKLREAGLAFPQRMPGQKATAPSLPNQPDSEPILPSFDTQKPKVQEWLHHEFKAANAQVELDQEKASFELLEDPRPMAQAPPKRDQKHKRPAYIPAKEKDRQCKEALSALAKIPTEIQEKVTAWKPALPFSKLEFVSWGTYVDYDGFIYIQDFNASRETAQLLQAGLFTCFDGSLPKPHDLVWSKGEICVAKFDVDGRWYRAKVTEVAADHVKVLFVDYGNIEEVKVKDLRKDVVMHHIPIQCHKCKLEGIIPCSDDGKWPEKTLDFIHIQVVEKECLVKLKPPAFDGDCYTVVDLTLPSEETLLDTLCTLKFAKYVVDCETLAEQSQLAEADEFILDPDETLKEQSPVVPVPALTDFSFDWSDMVEKQEEPSQVGVTFEPKVLLQYKTLEIPDNLVELSVEVGVVAGYNSVKIRVNECDDTELMKLTHEFSDLHDQIQEEAESLCPLVQPEVGLPCIGCYTEDNDWYRAEITQVIDENNVRVHYVDYGNEEQVSICRLREIKVEYMTVPAQCIQVYLHNITKGPEYNVQTYGLLMKNCFVNNPYLLTFERKFPRFEVNIYNDKGERPYQQLLDYQILAEEE